MSAARPGLLSYENRTVLLLAIAGGVAGIDMLAMAFLTPFVATELRLSDTQVGSIVTGQLMAWSVGGLLTSVWSDRLGRRRIFLVGAMVMFALFSVGTAFTTSFAMLLTARLLVGLAEGPVIPMQNAIMIDASSPHRRGLNMGVAQNFGAQLLGSILGPILLIWTATQFGWRNAFLIAGAPALVMAAVLHFGICEQGRSNGDATLAPLGETLRAIAGVRNIRLCFVVGVFAVAWYGTMLTFLPLWVTRHLGLPAASMSVVMSAIGVAGAVSAVAVSALSDRIGRRPTITIFALIGLVLPAGLLFGPGDLASVALFAFVGGLLMGIFPLFIGIVPMESVEARYGATALGLVMACAQIVGGFVGPFLGGVLSDRLSLAAPFWMSCGLAVCAAVASLFLKETAPRRLALNAT